MRSSSLSKSSRSHLYGMVLPASEKLFSDFALDAGTERPERATCARMGTNFGETSTRTIGHVW